MSVDKTHRSDAWPEQETVGPSRTDIIADNISAPHFKTFQVFLICCPKRPRVSHVPKVKCHILSMALYGAETWTLRAVE